MDALTTNIGENEGYYAIELKEQMVERNTNIVLEKFKEQQEMEYDIEENLLDNYQPSIAFDTLENKEKETTFDLLR